MVGEVASLTPLVEQRLIPVTLSGTELLACLVLKNFMDLRERFLLQLVCFTEAPDKGLFFALEPLRLAVFLRDFLDFILDKVCLHQSCPVALARLHLHVQVLERIRGCFDFLAPVLLGFELLAP